MSVDSITCGAGGSMTTVRDTQNTRAAQPRNELGHFVGRPKLDEARVRELIHDAVMFGRFASIIRYAVRLELAQAEKPKRRFKMPWIPIHRSLVALYFAFGVVVFVVAVVRTFGRA